MTSYETYTFLLCLIVYIMLTALSVACIAIITKMSLRIIRAGLDDERILGEYRKKVEHEDLNRFLEFFNYAFSFLLCIAFITAFISAFYVQSSDGKYTLTTDSNYRVVQTDSMEHKNAKNEYLFENKLYDQIQTIDVIKTAPLPDEMELELYDIVVYEVDDILVVHRIVEIEEPNESHPDCRHFKLQGDAIESPDRFPVLYEQMRAIYTGQRIPFVGSFVMFMQSPAGWLCILLILVAMIATPILEHKLEEAKDERLAYHGFVREDDDIIV